MAHAELLPGEIRAGLDMIVVSFRGADPMRALPDRLGNYWRQSDQLLKRKPGRKAPQSYARVACYLDPAAPAGLLLNILYQPRRREMPPFRAQIRAPMSRLIATVADLAEAARIAECIQEHVGGHSRVAQLELAIDYLGGSESVARALNAQVYCPRMRKVRRKHRPPDCRRPFFWEARGSKTSPVWLRIYAKAEDGQQCARTELVVQGPCNLKRLGLDDVQALARTDWMALFDRYVRFVAFEPLEQERRPRPIAPYVDDLIARLGPNRLLSGVPRADREYIRRRLRETPTGRRIREALRALHNNFAGSRSSSLESERKYQYQFRDAASVVSCEAMREPRRE